MIILFFSLFSFDVNSLNIKNYNNDELVYGYTILSPDNTHYTPPIKHILDNTGYTCPPSDKGMQVRRVPGYSLFYGIHYLIFGEKYSFL